MQTVYSSQELGCTVRAFRKREGLTQIQLADFCGLSASLISDVEHGKVLFLLHNLA